MLYSLKFDYNYLFQPTQLVLQAQNNQEAFHVKIDIATEEISRWMELVDVSKYNLHSILFISSEVCQSETNRGKRNFLGS